MVTPLQDITVTSPETITLECTFDLGEPEAEKRWKKNGNELKLSKIRDVTMSCQNGVAKLEMEHSEFEDNGKYSVEAKNKLEQVESHCNVNVLCKYILILTTFYLLSYLLTIFFYFTQFKSCALYCLRCSRGDPVKRQKNISQSWSAS